jgi:hypothetical protein
MKHAVAMAQARGRVAVVLSRGRFANAGKMSFIGDGWRGRSGLEARVDR